VLRGLFVTGTDTGVGKTVVSAALVLRYAREAPLRYWKPVQTGIERDDDTAEVMRLTRCGDTGVLNCGVRLPRPVSPHLAAQLSGHRIEIEPLAREIVAPSPSAWIVEGAGGALVPLNESQTLIDLMVRLSLPVVVATRTSLGTINHTLLTLEALRRRSLAVAGVVMVGEPDAANRDAIEHYGRVPVLGEMPHFDDLSPDRLAAWTVSGLDRRGELLELLR
jgi:dethiobiotin synthase